MKQYLELFEDDEDQSIIIVCKDEINGIDPITGQVDEVNHMFNIEQITTKNMSEIAKCVIELDDMGIKLNMKIEPY